MHYDLSQLGPLHKGRVLTQDEIERATGVPAARTDAYRLACLQLKVQIEREMRKGGEVVSIRAVDTDLHILDDPGQARYEKRMAERSRARIRRAHHKLEGVNLARLSDAELQQWDEAKRRTAWDVAHFNRRRPGPPAAGEGQTTENANG